MKILITGSEGFIGTHVRKRLYKHDLVRVDCLEPRVHPEPPLLFNGVDFAARAGDLWSTDLEDIDVLIHLGAQVGVADSMEDPWRYYRDNTEDTLRMLHNLRVLRNRPKKIIVASSMSIYGDPETEVPITENHPIRTTSVYGLTKFDQERLCLMYGKMLDIPVTAFRFFNVYGPGQALHNPYTGVLAIFANALLHDMPPTVYEDGQQTRDFVHVHDIADAITYAAHRDVPGVYNLSTGIATTIENVALSLAKALGKNIKPTITHTERHGDIRHCVGSKLRWKMRMPVWRPQSFETGVIEYAKGLPNV